jgi:hypothetical protein
VTVHERFGTATVEAGGHVYDLATARVETYARPGALPDVRRGTLEQDLLRRDFTVNAIAVGWTGASRRHRRWRTLDARMLRVLHERSFLDDPTAPASRALRDAAGLRGRGEHRRASRMRRCPEGPVDGLAARLGPERACCCASRLRPTRLRGSRSGRCWRGWRSSVRWPNGRWRCCPLTDAGSAARLRLSWGYACGAGAWLDALRVRRA